MTRAARSGAATRREYDVAVLGKALDLLERLAGGGAIGLSELAVQSNVTKASAFRVLATLERRGYVAKDPASRKYAPGPRLVALSSAVLGSLDLIRRTHAMLETLHAEFGETVNLGALVDDRVVYLTILESRHGLRSAARVGARDDLHSTALGKAILAHLPAAEVEQLLGAVPLARKTPRTITERGALLRELDVSRNRGYTVDDEENEAGARCVAVALRDRTGRPVAAISVSGPAGRMDGKAIPMIGRRLAAAAADVEMGIGADAIRSRQTRAPPSSIEGAAS